MEAPPGARSGTRHPSSGHRVRLASIGAALPETRLPMASRLARCRPGIQLDLERLTGIGEMRVSAGAVGADELAIDAARECLTHTDRDPAEIELLISCSISHYDAGLAWTWDPPVSVRVREALGATTARPFDITNACAGMMTGVWLLENAIRRGAVRCGMVVSGEHITPLADNAAREMRVPTSRQMASLTLGDAGAAVILERCEGEQLGILGSAFATAAEHDRLCIGKPCASGPGATMLTKPRKLHRVAIRDATPVIARALEASGRSWSDIDYFVPHQTSMRAIRAGNRVFCDAFDGDPAKSRIATTVKELGNTASTSHFVALRHALERGELRSGDDVMLLCFASGLVVGSMIFRCDELVDHYAREN